MNRRLVNSEEEILNALYRQLGGPGSGNFGHAGRPGEVGGSSSSVESAEKTRSERSLRALKAFKPANARIQRHAERNERLLRERIGGTATRLVQNEPVDLLVTFGDKKVGVEVKTLINNENDKITVRSKALEKKRRWGKENDAEIHTIVIDDRDAYNPKLFSGHKVYHRDDTGSFRLGTMTKVESDEHLRRLLKI